MNKLFQLFKHRFSKRVNSDGVLLDMAFVVVLNNNDPIQFSNRSDMSSYIKRFSKENEIFKLELYRIESYKL